MNAYKLKQIKFPLYLQSIRLSGNPSILSFENFSFPLTLRRIDLAECCLNAQKIQSLKLPKEMERIYMDENALHGQMHAVNK